MVKGGLRLEFPVPFRSPQGPLGVRSQRQCRGWQVLLHIDPCCLNRQKSQVFCWTVLEYTLHHQDYTMNPNIEFFGVYYQPQLTHNVECILGTKHRRRG